MGALLTTYPDALSLEELSRGRRWELLDNLNGANDCAKSDGKGVLILDVTPVNFYAHVVVGSSVTCITEALFSICSRSRKSQTCTICSTKVRMYAEL